MNTLDDTSDLNLGDQYPSDANGKTSLRSAIEQSNFDGAGKYFVEFDYDLADENGQITIVLSKSLEINESISINGDFYSSKNVSITGSGEFTLVVHTASKSSLNNLIFYGANAGKDFGGAIQNTGYLNVHTCEFNSNKSGKSGAIANSTGGTLVVGDSSFSFNTTENEGGAIYSADSSFLNVFYSSFRSC